MSYNVPKAPEPHIQLELIKKYPIIDGHLYSWKYNHKIMTTNKKGYVEVIHKGRHYRGHHIAWRLYYGEWPTCQIDHKDNDKTNNKKDNLREVKGALNRINVPKKPRYGVGVRKRYNRYIAEITVHTVKQYLGSFDNLDDAKNAYKKAHEKAYGLKLEDIFSDTEITERRM